MIGITTAIIHDKRVKRTDNTYAVKLRVTFNRIQKYYPVNTHLTEDEWEKVHSEKPRKTYKEHLMYFNEVEQKARKILKDLHPFSFATFEKRFNENPSAKQDVFVSMEAYVETLKAQGRASTADSYNCALNSLKSRQKALKRKKLHFWDVTVDWLNDYEKWMIEKGNSYTSVGIYLRSLRTILNQAIDEGNLSRESYPFGKHKYQIPAGRNIKKALGFKDIKRIANYKPANKYESKYRDLWLFSYACNGVNVKDIARLKYKNISDDEIHFVRSKTERSTKQDRQEITVPIVPVIQNIISDWGVKPAEPDNYIFGILSENDTPEQQLVKVKSTTKSINKFMDRIGQNLNLPYKPTTYFARHSFATNLKRLGASTELIKESLGHKDLRTTENYLDSFEKDIKKKFQKKLLNF